jgi:hypothetical protein
MPVVDQKLPGVGDGSQNGFGDVLQSLFYSPKKPATAAGLPNLKQDLIGGHKIDGRTYKVRLDGYRWLSVTSRKVVGSTRRSIRAFPLSSTC